MWPIFGLFITSCDGSGAEGSFIPEDAKYYVAVGGNDYAAGDFRLSIYEDNPVVNGCLDDFAVPLLPTQPLHIQGTTTNGAVFNSTICGSEDGPAARYHKRFSQSGEVNTCGAKNFDPVLQVYSGDCNYLHCVAKNDNSCDTKSSVVQYQQNLSIAVSGQWRFG